MKLTETQKNYRKEMEKLKNKNAVNESIYDQHLNRRKDDKDKSSSISSIIIISGFLLLLAWGTYASQDSEDTPIPTNAAGIYPSTEATSTESRVLSNREGTFLSNLNTSVKSVDEIMNSISEYNKISWELRDESTYVIQLLNATDICTREEICIKQLDTPDQFIPLAALALEYITYSREAVNNWHDGFISKNNSTIQKGNYYCKLSIAKRQAFMTELENYLMKNHYKYTKDDNDRIQWWYER